jgi:beta-glucosidase/6-phospho-beta-glucosidase/beta-galactosidase
MYLRTYLTHLQRATAEGAPVKSYFEWSAQPEPRRGFRLSGMS